MIRAGKLFKYDENPKNDLYNGYTCTETCTLVNN